MKTLNETFTDEEYRKLRKTKGKMNWHDFILLLNELKGRKEDERN